ncbi:hypothetical protein ASF70_18810 [Rhizobium sp. Leaf321]|uniref:hypothetical protein n=1 Tax=Rhizobium sp. Leaf321 TaxID=1736335 RepID=UPI0007162043|nr:hypothetical protein [Rhizobium sp. Leaf321]KQQ70900.1 hypothetical protein ASF70_18810 [Rhizobium sp. Leaf321]
MTSSPARLAHVHAREADQKAEDAWHEYADLSILAQNTLAVEDGVAAGKAWGRFMALFVEAEAPQP